VIDPESHEVVWSGTAPLDPSEEDLPAHDFFPDLDEVRAMAKAIVAGLPPDPASCTKRLRRRCYHEGSASWPERAPGTPGPP
jgi:hypothetical protein